MSSAGFRPTGCHAASGALIFYGLSGANRLFQLHKRSWLFIGVYNKTLSVVAMCISNKDCAAVGINRCDTAPRPTGLAELVSDDFLELHVELGGSILTSFT